MSTAAIPTGKYPFVGMTAAAIVGILLADFWPQPLLFSCLIVGSGLVSWIFARKTIPLLVFVSSVFFLLHGLQFFQNPGRVLAATLDSREVTITGTGVVDSAPTSIVSSNGRVRTVFQVRDSVVHLRDGTSLGPLSLLIKWPNAKPQIGDRLEFEGNLRNVRSPRNPGEFDYARWLAREQIFCEVSVYLERRAQITETGSLWKLRRWANLSKERLAAIVTRDLVQSPLEAGVITAMMLGAKDDTPDATLELFMRTGTLHLFSVSGLHVAMLASITLFMMLAMRIPRRSALLLTIPVVFAYALITGWSPSSVRAAIMTAAFVVATLMDRPSLSFNTLAIACFLILVFNTNQLFATGFQLSFSVVAAILVLSGPVSRQLQKVTEPDPFLPKKLLTPFQKTRWLVGNRCAGNLGLTIAAWLGSLPLTACYFNLLSPVALVSNLLIVPLAFLILTIGVLSVGASLFSTWLVVAFNNANWGLVKVLLALLSGFADLPASSFFVGSHWWQRPSEDRIVFFDLGKGGATVIETSSQCWLIDCGSDADYRRIVRRYLQMRGINHVDGIFLTHGDGTHVGGISQFHLDFPEARILLPEAGAGSLVFRKLAGNMSVERVVAGAAVWLDSQSKIDVLWPPEQVDGGQADDHCMVLKLELAGHDFLLTADAGYTSKAALLDADSPLRAEWLAMGRSRSDPGDTRRWLMRVRPKMILATATNFPASEKIPDELVELCRKLSTPLVRFDQTGAVQIVVQEARCEIIPFLPMDEHPEK